VDSDGFACISDYGLETALRDEARAKSIQTNIRWTAPEVLGKENRRVPSGDDGKAADVYSFGIVMFEVCLPAPRSSMCLNVSSLDLDRYHSIPERK